MNKITRKSFLKVLAATMVGGAAASALTGAAAPVSIDETNGKVSRWVKNNLNPEAGTYDATTNWLDTTRAGNTAHVDHANVLYQIPADSNGWPMVYLHGYGQSRMGWITTPDGRQGWADLFLRNGYSAFLVDQPRRGEAGSTAQMSTDGFLDTWSANSKDYKPGDQAWYTHFRIGRVAPERYEGSQFPEGDAAQNQFFRQMTPNTGDFDQAVAAAALGEVMKDVQTLTGHKSIFVTHSQGGAVGWDVPADNIAAIVAIEPGGTPAIGSEQYTKLLSAGIPIAIYFGDYIDNGPEDIMSTSFWRRVRDGALAFAAQYNADGGDCTVVDLPKIGITGNSHFMFQELNNKEIADHIYQWLESRALACYIDRGVFRMKNKISRRQFLQVAGASAAALLLASCSGNSASSVSSSSVASSEAASSAAASSEATSTVTTTGKTLVVYFSATGTTQGVAQTIADTVGADLFEVVPSDPYTSDDLNWTNNDSRVSREHNDEGLRAVALESTDVDGWDDYDTVFIGYPIWWGIAAWPMSSFVAVNDFTGKNVVPFCTSLSSGIGQSGKLLAELADAGTWLDGQRFSHSSSEADIASWVNGLNL